MRTRAGHPRREYQAIIEAIPRAHVTYRSQSLGGTIARIYLPYLHIVRAFFTADHPKLTSTQNLQPGSDKKFFNRHSCVNRRHQNP